MSRIVVALGGNALGKTPSEQLNLVKSTAKSIVDIIEEGNEVIIAHGNGPQVGMINSAMESVDMPFPECGAMSQGYIGYHLQNSIRTELENRGIIKEVVTVITQVIVDKEDNAFDNPTKPIGTFFTEEDANKIADEKGFIFKEDAGRGYRRVVPSPMPIDVVEKNVVKTLLDAGHIVITVGGGGIPVTKENGCLVGVPAVIDKDLASEKIAEILDADYLLILTVVEKVAINFKKPDQRDLAELSIEEAKKYADEGHFMKGSMLPKVLASVKFAESKKNRISIITSLHKAKEALKGESGTIIKHK